MSEYQPTEEEVGFLARIHEFRSDIRDWSAARRPGDRELARSRINRKLEGVREIVALAGCHQTMTMTPPALIGGVVLRGIDPFSYIFEPVYGQDLGKIVCDLLDQAIGVIEEGKFGSRREALSRAAGPMGPISGSKVFLVHGHDEGAREKTARFLEKLRLEPVILHEQINAGRTIIEKFEYFSGVAVAVVLLTPDDMGFKHGEESCPRFRARQNVILELGFFLGKLGRSHVVALVKGDIEKPSDYDGVVYIELDLEGGWRLRLAKELKGAGLNVDLNDAM